MTKSKGVNKSPSVLFIGPFSEIGGVSVHIKRIISLLEGEICAKVINESSLADTGEKVFNIRSLNLFKYYNLLIHADYVHIHSGSLIFRVFHLLSSFILRKKIIITLHSYRYTSGVLNLLLKHLPYKVIAVNEEINARLKDIASFVLHAFIPPTMGKEPDLDDDLNSFLENKKKQGRFIIIGNAFRIVVNDGNDLYGIDQLIELANLCKKRSLPFFIIFVIGSLVNGRKEYSRYLDEISSKKLNDHILLYTKPTPFTKLIEKSDLIIRPTLSDGDSLTIREALFLEKPVIASDVVKRPTNTVIYKCGDIEDLLQKIIVVIENKADKNVSPDTSDYKNIYRELYC